MDLANPPYPSSWDQIEDMPTNRALFGFEEYQGKLIAFGGSPYGHKVLFGIKLMNMILQ